MSYEKKIEKTIVVGVSWIVFILLSLVFNPLKFGFWQNLSSMLISGVVSGGIVALTWVDGCL